jgi:hypothetical protein
MNNCDPGYMTEDANAVQPTKKVMNQQTSETAPVANAKPPASDANASGSEKPKPMEKLSAEEQMALYEKELKENDWGHQPC